MTTHHHNPEDEKLVRQNWEATEVVVDSLMDIMREFSQDSCAPWCVPADFENLVASYDSHQLMALLHVAMYRLLNREDLDRGLDAPTPP